MSNQSEQSDAVFIDERILLSGIEEENRWNQIKEKLESINPLQKPQKLKMSYEDWSMGHDLKAGDTIQTVNCSYEDGQVIWDAALKHGIQKTVSETCTESSKESICNSCLCDCVLDELSENDSFVISQCARFRHI